MKIMKTYGGFYRLDIGQHSVLLSEEDVKELIEVAGAALGAGAPYKYDIVASDLRKMEVGEELRGRLDKTNMNSLQSNISQMKRRKGMEWRLKRDKRLNTVTFLRVR